MNRSHLIFSIWLFLFFPAATARAQAPSSQEPRAPWVIRAFFSNDEMLRQVSRWGEPWMVDHENGFFIMEADENVIGQLLELGMAVDIDEQLSADFHRLNVPLEDQGSGIPGFPCYATVDETYQIGQDLALDHPNLAAWIDIGDSWEKTRNAQDGSDLFVLKLTNNLIPGPKPVLFVMSALHAREYATAGITTRFAQYLVDQYGVDADATWILDYHELHLLLHANPDGRKQAETGLNWRKNTDNDFCSNSTNRGIDLNRNFEFMWGCCGGSSSSECSSVFRGPSSESEPETQAIIGYVRTIFPDQRGPGLQDPAPADATGVFLDIHSFSQLVLWPYGFNQTQAPNGVGLQTLGRKLAFFNNYGPEKASVSFNTDGTTDDFAYGDLGVAAFTFEVGTSFFQSCQTFENVILPDNLAALLYAAKSARTPYLTPAGPDVDNLLPDSPSIMAGQPLTVTAMIDDTRYNHSNGTQASQNIAAAEYYIDAPPWAEVDLATAFPFSASDGTFNGPTEAVEAIVVTTGLSLGRHILFARGRDASGSWGALSAIFFDVFQDFLSMLPVWPGTISVLDLAAQINQEPSSPAAAPRPAAP